MFYMHDLRSVSFCLGMNIEHNWEHHTIDIYQHSPIQTIIAKFTMDESMPVAKQMAMKKSDEHACNQTICQSMIGSCIYAMTTTQPDIACAFVLISQ